VQAARDEYQKAWQKPFPLSYPASTRKKEPDITNRMKGMVI
jgi:hypothetical protein